MSDPKSATGNVIAVLGLGVLAWGAYSLYDCVSYVKGEQKGAVAERPVIPSIHVGDVVGLVESRSPFGFDTQESIEQFVKAIVAKDKVGYTAVVQEHAVPLRGQLRALVIDQTWNGLRQVRIKDGLFAEKALWVQVEDLEPLAPEPAAAASPEQSQELQAFLAWVKGRIGTSVDVKVQPELCEKSGRNRGLCDNYENVGGDGGKVYATHFFKQNLQAIRFTGHVAAKLSCEMLDADTLRTWEPPPGSPAVSGSVCRFRTSPLAGLGVFIENNRGPSGFNTGVHVFTHDYLVTDRAFAEGIESDAKRAAN
jgi:hypothetical protein